MPAGEFRAKDGRPHKVDAWHIDATTAAAVIARNLMKRDKVVIDYEHQTLYAETNGQPAPAAGWYDPAKLEWRDGDGLYATGIEWTPAAIEKIRNKEYRYFSPVIVYDKNTGAVIDIMMGALTNYAAIDGLTEIGELAAARFKLNDQENDTMLEELLKALGLESDVKQEDAIAAVTALKAKSEGVDALKQKADKVPALEAEIATLKASGSGTPDPSKYVPIEIVTDLQTEVAKLRGDMTTKTVADLVEDALSAGKLLPTMKDWATELGKKDIEALKGYIEKAQPIAALKGRQTDGNRPGNDDPAALTETEIAVCKQLGITHDEFRKTRQAEREAATAA